MLNIKIEEGKNKITLKSIRSMKVVNDLINIFNQYKNINNKNFVLDFSELSSRAFPPTLVSIAGISDYYREKYGFNIEFITKKNKYFTHTSTESPIPVSNNGITNIENIFDQVITFSSDKDVSFISNAITNYLKTNISCEEGVLIGLSWCMNEVMDNVLWHSEVSKGYFMSQIHKENKLISISIYDNGIGLLNSINASKQYFEKTDVDAIRRVIEKGVTCNPEIGQGNGLWGLYQIVKDSHGYMTIKTGSTKIEFNFKDSKENVSLNNAYLDSHNKGTRVDFTLKFNQLIDVSKALDNYIPLESVSMELEEMLTETNWIDLIISEKAKGGTGTRASGKDIRLYTLNTAKLSSYPILLDFLNIDVISSSFADEFIGKLAADIGIIEFTNHFKIINANDFVKGLLNKAIAERIKQKV